MMLYKDREYNMEQTKYDVFISYSRKDYVDEHKNVIPGNEVSKIKDALTNAGISYWFDEKGIVSGEDYAAKIVKHIKASKIIVYISSEAANKSDWTRKEIACALMYKKYVIPVLLDDSPFHDSVMLRIVDLDRIDYYLNPQQGLDKLIRSINTYLEDQQAIIARKVADDKRRQEELESQHRLKEEEQKRQKRIDEIETEIAALESQKVEHKKAILQKEQELKLAQVDLEECESKIQKLQQKLQELRDSYFKDKVFSVNGVSFKMIHVEGGKFLMGCNDGEYREMPVHEVTVSDYFIGESEVTQALWKIVMGNNPSRFINDNHPVECVTWFDCQLFIKKLNEQLKHELSGYIFRLPTEAEWEFAARGGKNQEMEYAGNYPVNHIAWYYNNSDNTTHPIKNKLPNELGIYDMSGNVWEWCQDWYGDYNSTPQINPKGPLTGFFRVLRGGSWEGLSSFCRVAFRYSNNPKTSDDHIGIRLALVKP